MTNLLAIILWAFGQWGVTPIPVRVSIEPITWTVAYTNTFPDTAQETELHFDPTWLATATDADIHSVTLHEVGHVIGLPHYGSCNEPIAIMGCSTLGFVSSYDHLQLARLHPMSRMLVPLIAQD